MASTQQIISGVRMSGVHELPTPERIDSLPLVPASAVIAFVTPGIVDGVVTPDRMLEWSDRYSNQLGPRTQGVNNG